jgi:hypothetical protein
MSGTVGVPCNDAARYSFFAASLTSMIVPKNTGIRWAIGSDRIRGRNRIVTESLEVGSEWLLFLDDDQSFPSGLLMRLLSHDQPVVASLYLQRMFPFKPVAFSDRNDDDNTYVPLFLHDYPVDQGLVPVRAAGTGGMLIRSEVFHKLVVEGICDYGVWFKDGEASEDLMFCEKVHEAGFPIYVDLQAKMGHCSTSVIWPSSVDEEWCIGAQVSADYMARFPIATRDEEAAMEAAAAADSNGGVSEQR